jgi:hypothetical protein
MQTYRSDPERGCGLMIVAALVVVGVLGLVLLLAMFAFPPR